jgi:hypothetical protein
VIARLFSAAACAALAANAAADARFTNVTAGGVLRPGVYGRIQVRDVTPPLIHARPVVAERPLAHPPRAPVYLYVPAGQVRRWSRHCQKWDACDRPVYFVRMDASPGRLGEWKRAQRPPSPPSVLHALNRFTQ